MLEHNDFCADFILFIFTAKTQLEKTLEKKEKKGKGHLPGSGRRPPQPPLSSWPSLAQRSSPAQFLSAPAEQRAEPTTRAPPSSPLSGDWPLHFLSPIARAHAAASPLPLPFFSTVTKLGSLPRDSRSPRDSLPRTSVGCPYMKPGRTTLICFRLRSCRVPFAQVWISPNLSLSISRGRPLSEPSRVAKRALVSSQ